MTNPNPTIQFSPERESCAGGVLRGRSILVTRFNGAAPLLRRASDLVTSEPRLPDTRPALTGWPGLMASFTGLIPKKNVTPPLFTPAKGFA